MNTDLRTTGKRKKAYALLFLIVTAVQMAVVFFYLTQKENYFLDELFSFGYAHTFTFAKTDIQYFYRSSAWQYETWIANRALKDQLRVTAAESLLGQTPRRALSLLLKRHPYYGLLNLLMSVFAPGSLSVYPGGLFNIFLLFVTQLLLYRITKELSGSGPAALLAVGLYGFSTMAVNMAIYIRFYTLVTALFLGAVRLHQIMWRTGAIWKFELLTAAAMALCYFGMRDSQLVFILSGALIGFFVLMLLGRRQYAKALCYLATTVPAGLYYAAKANYLAILLHPAEFTEKPWPINVMTSSVLDMDPSSFWQNTKRCAKCFADRLFGSRYIMYGFAGVVLILFGIRLFTKGKASDRGRREAGSESRFFWVIAGTVFIYLLFSVLTGLPSPRYLSPVFPLVCVLLCCAVSFLAADKRVRAWALLLCMALTLYGTVSQHILNRNMSHTYTGDREVFQAVEDTGVEDVILIFAGAITGEHGVYDCVSLMPDSARVYPVNREHHRIDTDSCPDELLIWILRDSAIEPYTEDLTSGGFQIERIGTNHTSDIYLARRAADTEETA